MDDLLSDDFATCDAIRLEVLAGARDDEHLHLLRRMLAGAKHMPLGSADYETAAGLYRTCRRKGKTVRKLIDHLIAAVAIREAFPCSTPTQTSTSWRSTRPLRIDTPG